MVKTALTEPPMHLGVKQFPLVLRRIPVEGVEPAPAPIAMHGDRREGMEHTAELGHAIEVIKRNGHHAKNEYHSQGATRGNGGDHIGKLVTDPLPLIKINLEAAAQR